MLNSLLEMTKGILEQVRELPLEERKRLAYEIWATVDAEAPAEALTAEERQILEQRLDAHLRKPENAEPWERIRERLLRPE